MGRGMKKILIERKLSIFIFALLGMAMAVLMGAGTDCLAAGMTTPYNLEQAQGQAPRVKAYVNGSKASGKMQLQGKVTGTEFPSGVNLRQEGIQRFSDSGEGMHYIVLFDNSASVDASQFKRAKKELLKMRQSLRDQDRMELYTVGSKHSRGEKKRIIASQGKKNLSKDKAQLRKIARTGKKTVLYRSLTQILKSVDNGGQRTAVLLVTDGEDDSQGKNNRTYEVNPAAGDSKVPIYGILLKNISKKPNREKMKNTREKILKEEIGRGYFEECASAGSVSSGFSAIKKIWMQDTFVVSFREENNSNQTMAKAALTLSGDGAEMTLKAGEFSYSEVGEADNQPPEISDIKKTGGKSIQFCLKDAECKVVLGADKAENYTVKSEDNKVWKIAKVSRKSAVDDTYEMVFEEELYSGKYTIECAGITDGSQEKNAVKGKIAFDFKGLDEKKEQMKDMVKSYWWILLFGIVLAIGIILVVIAKRRPGKIVEVESDTLHKADSKMIRLTITDRTGAIKDVEWTVEGSIFVGRSDICNIYFDDDRLSKQHFAIEATKMACYIEDLETTNGTFVNGVKLSGRRMLLDGDEIAAGREKFRFYLVDGGGDRQT